MPEDLRFNVKLISVLESIEIKIKGQSSICHPRFLVVAGVDRAAIQEPWLRFVLETSPSNKRKLKETKYK